MDLLEEMEIRFEENIQLYTDEEQGPKGRFDFVIAVDLLVQFQPEAHPSFQIWSEIEGAPREA